MICEAIAISAALLMDGAPPPRDFTFADQSGRRMDARISAPPADACVGASVLLIGGGAAWDLRWTVPASYVVDGKTTEVTISGSDHHDADTLTRALVERGLVVVQWSSIAPDDEQGRRNPALAMGIPFPESVELARAALKAAREQPEFNADRVIIVAHSLGAVRAARIADDGVIGLVALAGAYLSNSACSPAEAASEALKNAGAADADRDGAISPGEFSAWRAAEPRRASIDWAALDRDTDGLARPWELAAADRLAKSADPLAPDPERPQFAGGTWPLEIIRARALPTLALFGGLDPISMHGPIMELAAKRGAPIEVVYFKHRGHQLGGESGGKIGPIDPEIAARAAEWASHAGAQANRQAEKGGSNK